MHHDYLLIATHLGAPLSPIVRALSNSGEVSINQTPIAYSAPTDLRSLRILCERQKKARIYVDKSFYNHSIRTMSLNNICTFLYFLGDPKCTITALVKEYNYTAEKAYDYYAFRLQRLAMMSKQTHRAALLTSDAFTNENARLLSDLIRLKTPLHFSVESEDSHTKPAEGAIADKACIVYDRYLKQIQTNLKELANV